MCGIVGHYLLDRLCIDEATGTTKRMAERLRHRGPDGDGFWMDATERLYLGHRRLAVVDLSEQGRQPMMSASGRYVVTFNGEIYNFEALRADLWKAGAGTNVRSDTAVLLAAIEHWGICAALSHLSGMFAFAVWDRRERELTLVRDRLGKKPLYYALTGGGLAFASELRALREIPGIEWQVHPQALAGYFGRGYVSGEQAIIRGVFKVAPGSLVTIRAADRVTTDLIKSTYWSVSEYPQRSDGIVTYDQSVDELEAILRRAVADRLVADVPVGAFLSGGVDSSAIVAIAQSIANRPVKTFTIGFDDPSFDESGFARDVAAILGTEHTEVTVTDTESRAIVPTLGALFDEPFGDSSQIPTLLISRIARSAVTVALSGDGGDELFGGYSRYFIAEKLVREMRRLPRFAGRWVAEIVRLVPGALWNSIGVVAPGMFGSAPGTVRPAQQALKLANLMSMDSLDQVYCYLLQHWPVGAACVFDDALSSEALSATSMVPGQDAFDWMGRRDLREYLPDDILVKVDRASMAVSLEVRAPLLDREVVEFALRLPTEAKVIGGRGKRILRDVLYRYVPRELIDRPKVGFGVPLDSWLRAGLRDWAEDLMSEAALKESGLLQVASIRHVWQTHQAGRANWGTRIWDVLMFQAWQREQGLA